MLDGKQPYAIARKGRASLAFASVWEGWRGSDGVTLRRFILTTVTNSTMQALHNRMPVILEQEHWPEWLGDRAGEPTSLMRPADGGLLHLWAVNSVRNNSPDLLDRTDDPHPPYPSDAPPANNPA